MTAADRPPRPVQVWWARLADTHPELVGLLDPVELGRYEATADPDNRRRFLAGCAVSRLVLGELLGVRPADVPLRRVCPRCGGPHGKVTLDVPTGSAHADVRFSVSHSGDVIGLAVCRGADVGLDVEDGVGADVEKVAPRVLADTELAALQARPPAERPAAFLRYWTRKESVLKAIGVGLRVPLRRLEVSDPKLPPAVLRWPEKMDACQEVRMADTVVGTTHPASVSVTGTTEVTLVRHDTSAMIRAWR
ncbi:4'-phosphopantetheinyl transferase family protein [Streptomyces rishiriensis]|uniref:4'-phosphopantetheinyl transferase n=1 Tax=Streptomyces rishiriensis TaxID=68264 RepID=A0ABU0NHQ4_STRRH|nr:4'-phosphopantetheinyl transferase superfamily protein [Streptomyces rishiriensis]MDQ0578614.1 4'-phosphopantetheinyl transferase [Streptomyces rishiriensis]